VLAAFRGQAQLPAMPPLCCTGAFYPMTGDGYPNGSQRAGRRPRSPAHGSPPGACRPRVTADLAVSVAQTGGTGEAGAEVRRGSLVQGCVVPLISSSLRTAETQW